MATYGYRENKGKDEVYTKEDFAVLTGEYVLAASTTEEEHVATHWNINYPEGFNQSNTVVLAFQGTIASNIGAYGTSWGRFNDALRGTVPRTVSLLDDEINLEVYSNQLTEVAYNYKIVLMKAE